MISIIIPYYKLSFFEETLQSLANQTDKRFKVYIGNDASPENPAKLLEKFKYELDFKYKRFETNLGGLSLVKQWERCIAMTNNEEWILILGDDDVLGKNVVRDFYENIDEIDNKALNVVKFATQCIDEEGEVSSKVFSSDTLTASLNAFVNRLNGVSRSSLSEHIFRKTAYNKFGFRSYELAWHSDDMAWLEFSNFKNIFCINSEIIYIRISKISITGKNDQLNVKLRSSSRFYNELLTTYKVNFNKSEIDLILRIYEGKLILVEGKSLAVYLTMVRFYLKHCNFIAVIRFTYRILFK